MSGASKSGSKGEAKTEHLTLTTTNIGGNLGEHAFSFRPGLNLFLSRNALGASSTIDAVKLVLGGEEGLDFMLHELANKGSVELLVGRGDKYWANIERTRDKGVVINDRKSILPDAYAASALVVDETHPLRDLDDANLHTFLHRISGVDKLDEQCEKLSEALEKQKEKVEVLESKKRSLDSHEAEIARISQQRSAKDKRLKDALKESRPLTEQEKKEREELLKEASEFKSRIAQAEMALDETVKEKAVITRNMEALAAIKEKKDEVKKLKETKQTLDARLQASAKLISIHDSYAVLLQIINGDGEQAKSLGIDLDDCPICQLFPSINCNLKRISPSSRIDVANKIATREKERRSEIVKEREKELEKYVTHDEEMKNADEQLRELRERSRERSRKLSSAKSVLDALRGQYLSLRRRLDEIDQNLASVVESEALEEEVKSLQQKLSDAMTKNVEYVASADEVTKAINRKNELTKELQSARDLAKKRLDDARLKFNAEAAAVMNEIGLKGIRDFKLDEKFRAIVTSTKDGKEFPEKLGDLSTSEAVVMRILLAFAAKRAYFQDVPVFAMDTITTNLDNERFSKLLAYLKDKVPFLVATALSSEHKQLTLVHSVATL